MLHIILLILKILGIIFLILLGILLLVLYSVLFVAAAYRIRIQKQDAFRISADAGWLFRIVTIHFFLDGKDGWKKDLQIRLFGFPIKKPFEEKKPKKQKRRHLKKKTALQDAQVFADPGVPAPEEEEEQALYSLPEDSPDRSRQELKLPVRPPKQNKGAERRRRTEKQRHRHSPLEKLRMVFRKLVYASKSICDKIKRIRERMIGAGDSVRRLLQRRDALLEFWCLEEHRRARGAVLKEIQYLWKKSRPKKIQGKVIFGFRDPSITGMCLGGMSMLYAWYPDRLELAPDFEQEILEGDILIRGKVRFYVLACILWRIYFNQDIRHMYEHWKQL